MDAITERLKMPLLETIIRNDDRIDSKKLLLCLSLSTLMLGILIYSGLVSTLFINLIPTHPDILDWWLISDAYWTGKPTPNVVFNYPPTFLILNLPLGLLDFPAAYFTFIFGSCKMVLCDIQEEVNIRAI
jgi:hypothetical protein